MTIAPAGAPSRQSILRMDHLGLIVLFALLSSSLSAAGAQPSSKEMDELASDKGCYLCHLAELGRPGPNQLLPPAPSWKDIAIKYRGQKDAEDRLTEIVISGSGRGGKERHWQGKVRDAGMLPNIKELDEEQAKQLVHWILSFAP
jgi:cytochrome c